MERHPDLAELVRGAAAALNRGDLGDFLRYMDPEVEFTSMIAEAEGETFRAHDGVRRWWHNVRDAFEDATWDYLDIRGEGERGVAYLRISGKLGGVDVSQTMWQALRMREGRARWWAFFRTEAEALAAVRISAD